MSGCRPLGSTRRHRKLSTRAASARKTEASQSKLLAAGHQWMADTSSSLIQFTAEGHQSTTVRKPHHCPGSKVVPWREHGTHRRIESKSAAAKTGCLFRWCGRFDERRAALLGNLDYPSVDLGLGKPSAGVQTTTYQAIAEDYRFKHGSFGSIAAWMD
jgi:hypothetical protein